jgi:hypothetical protein
MTDRLSEGHRTVLTLLIVDIHENLHTLLQLTTTPQLFMMSCDTNELRNVETKQTFESLFSSLMKIQSVKIILNTLTENYTVTLQKDTAKKSTQ